MLKNCPDENLIDTNLVKEAARAQAYHGQPVQEFATKHGLPYATLWNRINKIGVYGSYSPALTPAEEDKRHHNANEGIEELEGWEDGRDYD